MIEQKKQPSVGFKNYKKIDFYTICHGHGHHNSDSDSFLNRNGITFEDYVGSKYLTGNELLYYPKLSAAMREVTEYPILTRTYAVDEKISGLDFIKYFYELVKKCFDSFRAELTLASTEVDYLINKYGMKREIPIIDRIDVEQVNSCYQRKKLVINGIAWHFNQDNFQKLKITEFLDFRSLLEIPFDAYRVSLEDAMIGTPFIALRIAKSWHHKGHVNWYDLNTLMKVSRTDAMKAK